LKTSRDEGKEIVSVDFDELIHKTDGAMLFSFNGVEEWIPRSIIENEADLDDPKGEDQCVDIPQWKAEQLGLS
jgi:hypothetical protein